jgi:hypothetical protein
MARTIIYLISILGILSAADLSAQTSGTGNQFGEKIRGTRFMPYPNYTGKPYLYDKFIFGEIELTDGTKINNIGLSYSTYRDELIYYNIDISAQIVIDKLSLKGFSLKEANGKQRIFRRMQSNSFSHEERYYELLCEGKVSLLTYRKVNLEPCDTYYSKSGLAYQPAYIYYLYSSEKGFSALNPSRNSLLSKFNKANQKLVKKLLRKNGVFITDESSFIKAWTLIAEKNIETNF